MHQRFEILALLMIAASAQIAADLYTPSLPAIAQHFAISMGESQRSLAIYMLALTLTQLLWGYLAERWGRKHALAWGLSLASVGALACALAPHSSVLLAGRFLQGFGNGAAAGLWRAIFRDRYTGTELAQVASLFGNLLVFILISAPLLGGALQEYGSWRLSFHCLLAWSLTSLVLLVLFVQASPAPSLAPRPSALAAYRRLLQSPVFMGCCLCNFLSYGGMFAWITAGAAMLVEDLSVSPLHFGFGSALSGVAMFIGSAINGASVKRFGIPTMLMAGWSIIAAAGLFLLASSLVASASPVLILGSVFFFYIGSALIFANTFATAFAPFGDIAGIAAGLYAFIQLAGGAAASSLLAIVPHAGPTFLGALFAGSALLAALSYRLMVYRQAKTT